ncbi:hypothetical protein LguiB_003469 [Lonicera macranthoides]
MKLKFLTVITSLFFLLLLSLPLIITDLSSDRNALLEFAASVPHLKKLNWNSSVSLCTSWVGITCGKNRTRNRVIAIHLPGIGLYGTIPPNTIGKLDALRVLSLHSNALYGNLSPDILSLPSLRALYLQHNNLSGHLPLSISPLIRVIDFSFNSISGFIPDINLPRLKLLNLSYNFFNGSIPISFKNFPISSFMGNPLLCGSPLTDCSSMSSSFENQNPLSHSKKISAGSIIGIAIGGCLPVFLLALALLFCFLKKKQSGRIGITKKKVASSGKRAKPEDFGSGVQEAEKNKLVFFEGSTYNFDLEDLLRASAEVLGKGGYGAAYKVVLDEDTTVVVKRLKEVGVGKKEFEQHMEVLGRVGKNPNVVPLLAYYYSKDEMLLVYEYMPNSSLSSLLHGNREIGRTLDWESRKKISIGVAKGIAHIHSEGGDKFAHGNIKSSNVLLTRDLDGCISDIGLTPLVNFPLNKSRGAGYRAPEVIETMKFTQKSDVYSFGVVLLEMLTGKTPIQFTRRAEAIDLPRWVRSVVREEWTAEVFDVELMRYGNIEEEMVQVLQIALACVANVANMRPTMDEVVNLIEEIGQPTTLDNCPSSEESNSKNYNVQTP